MIGPDTQTTCGNPSSRLQIGTEYVVGIGGVCSPIEAWSELSSYSTHEVELMRSFRNEMGYGTTTPSDGTTTTTSSTLEATFPTSSCCSYHSFTPLTLILLYLHAFL